ncbi:ligase-associated DNA damage response endonuclease PdeM [Noviherbaspirillum malthae]|jgi:DNA ligase-associated metallophosphoesterase|uniref:ligase-associated DNA damage response endonuclease PdeM n=1 Tax=Noviherbaspirillum malthae TaxID=1260987 RepID=UPI00188F465D|nr:ligase-associated DNA damage response endonuclease PdeM [Noviherbaspirillum malthae]
MSVDIVIAGETLQLLPQRALYWPARRTLMIADIHFGKAAAFRARGVPVPHGTTAQNLALIDTLLQAHAVEHIVFLGDFLHSRAVQNSASLHTLQQWRETHADLKLTLVRGNHDAHAGDPPAALEMDIVDEPFCIGPFACCHHPEPRAEGYVLAGHVHPVYRLAAGGDSLRLPCFLFGDGYAVLPSFGAFTGGYLVMPKEGERLFVAAEDAVFEVPLR